MGPLGSSGVSFEMQIPGSLSFFLNEIGCGGTGGAGICIFSSLQVILTLPEWWFWVVRKP